ncbi:hypothetical protein BDZ91DRAFT_660501 [Kalaharituber pfeilii]|nr:hypothetical protein BDZ91DRAFT_660501 [Kalaharituber pfeilii]
MGALGEGQRGPGREARPASEFLPPRVPTNTNTSQSPHPPSDSGLSAFPHPNPNPTSNTPRADTVTLESAEGAQGERPQSTPHSPSAAVREDRNGAGENNSHPTSGNGSNPSQRRQGGEGTRSWIIYVLGGSYPENHPILTTPSLFTDSPTYEDMMLLSSLLGPAKPPVATREEIDSAGGLFTVTDVLPVGAGSQYRKLAEGDRCLVCLSEYEPGEECRSLAQCQHVFHKECIDTWLTTGRNSCPLCRGQGVEEKESRVQPSAADTVT